MTLTITQTLTLTSKFTYWTSQFFAHMLALDLINHKYNCRGTLRKKILKFEWRVIKQASYVTVEYRVIDHHPLNIYIQHLLLQLFVLYLLCISFNIMICID